MKNFILSFLIIISANFNFSQVNIVSFVEEPDICEFQCMGWLYVEATGTGTLHSSLGLGTFYEEGGYYIYSDVSGKDVLNHSLDHGIDMGISLYLNKFIIGLKYDTARNQLRFLAGWSFRLPK